MNNTTHLCPAGIIPVSKSEIPDAKPWGSRSTARSAWANKVVREFLDCKDDVWKIDVDHLGKPPANSRETGKIASALRRATRKAEFKGWNLEVFQRGRSVYLMFKE